VPVKSEQRKIQSGLDIKTFLSRLRLVNEVVFACEHFMDSCFPDLILIIQKQ
jgi:hypothetical protein